jgi:hypothetical protein
VPALADIQSAVARAVVGGAAEAMPRGLRGGRDPTRRLAVHQRHYVASVAAALADKFPATAWLVGADGLVAAARDYARERPPRAPCIAEYGGDFPRFIAARVTALPCLEEFAVLESWAVRASIAVTRRPLVWPAFAAHEVETLLRSRVELQPGVRYERLRFNVDELLRVYLENLDAPRFELRAEAVALELRGARGELAFCRLGAASFAFRAALAARSSVENAAAQALEADSAFDAGAELRRMVEEKLVVELRVAGPYAAEGLAG